MDSSFCGGIGLRKVKKYIETPKLSARSAPYIYIYTSYRYIIASRMPAPPPQKPKVFHPFSKKRHTVLHFWTDSATRSVWFPPPGISQNIKKPMYFHLFASRPPKALQSECSSRFRFPRPSPGPLQKCQEFFTFDHFGSWAPHGVILASPDLRLGTLWRSLGLSCPPQVPPDIFMLPDLVVFLTTFALGTLMGSSWHLLIFALGPLGRSLALSWSPPVPL